MRKLEDIAEVMVGQIMTRVSSKDEDGKEVKVMIPGAINQGYINEAALGSANLTKELDEKFYTRPGDLIMKLTPDYDVAIIEERDTGIALSSFVCAIRAKKMDSNYLCAVLNSDYVKRQLRMNAGTGIRAMLKVSDIRRLPIPEIDEEKQRDLGRAFLLSTNKVQTLQELIDNEKALMKAVVNNCVMEKINDEEE